MTKKNGLSLIEVIVAAGLLVTTITISSKLITATGRLSQESRYHRLALEEAANYLERIRTGDPVLNSESSFNEPSPRVSATLPNVVLLPSLVQDELGARVEVVVRWGQQNRMREVRLQGWLDRQTEPPQFLQPQGD